METNAIEKQVSVISTSNCNLENQWKMFLTEDEVNRIFKSINLTNLNVIEIIPCYSAASDEYSAIITAKKDNGDSVSVFIDARLGHPTWQQFINVTYDAGKSADVKIMIYDGPANGRWNEPAGDICAIGNLIKRNNECDVTTYLVEAEGLVNNIISDANKYNIFYKMDDGPYIEILGTFHPISKDNKTIQDLPSKLDIQKAEFWVGYYLPNWDTEPVGGDDNIIKDWEPGYSLSHDLSTKAVWNEHGCFIDLVSEFDSEIIEWIWDNRKSSFIEAYPNNAIVLKNEKGKPFAISVRLSCIPVEELVNMETRDKWQYGEMVYSEEHKFVSIANAAIDDYDKAKEVYQLK